MTTVDRSGKVIEKSTTTETNTFDKKGNLTKSVYNSSSKGDGYSSTTKSTDRYKYKAVKVAKKFWKLFQ